MRRRMAAIALAAFTIALTGCAAKKTTSGATPGAATGQTLPQSAPAAAQAPEVLSSPSYWRLIELRGVPISTPAEGMKGSSLVFDKDGTKVHGYGGCSNFAGNCEYMPGNGLRVSRITVSARGCPDPTIEDEFLRVLQTVDNYYTDGKVLKLQWAKLAPLAVLEAVGAEKE
jgi:heat shock protein HslJ